MCRQVSSRLEQQAVGQEDMARRMVAIPSIRGGEGIRGHTVATDNLMLREFIIVRVLGPGWMEWWPNKPRKVAQLPKVHTLLAKVVVICQWVVANWL